MRHSLLSYATKSENSHDLISFLQSDYEMRIKSHSICMVTLIIKNLIKFENKIFSTRNDKCFMALIFLISITARLGLVEILSQFLIYYALQLKKAGIE